MTFSVSGLAKPESWRSSLLILSRGWAPGLLVVRDVAVSRLHGLSLSVICDKAWAWIRS